MAAGNNSDKGKGNDPETNTDKAEKAAKSPQYIGPDYKGSIDLGARRGTIDPKSWNADNIEAMTARFPKEAARYFK